MFQRTQYIRNIPHVVVNLPIQALEHEIEEHVRLHSHVAPGASIQEFLNATSNGKWSSEADERRFTTLLGTKEESRAHIAEVGIGGPPAVHLEPAVSLGQICTRVVHDACC